MFRDTGQTLEDFIEIIYVRCPKCSQCARVMRITSSEDASLAGNADRSGSWKFGRSFNPRKLSCLHCGYTKTWEGNTLYRGGPYDWYFRLPLWLQTPCCSKILWALNEEHLSFLESYVIAKQRTKFNVQGQMRNQTMASRLPDWMKSAKNRYEVVKRIAQLRGILEKM